jgi:hypothetical protein
MISAQKAQIIAQTSDKSQQFEKTVKSCLRFLKMFKRKKRFFSRATRQ